MFRIIASLLVISTSIFTIAQVDTTFTKTFGGSGSEVFGLTIITGIGSPNASIDTTGNFAYVLSTSPSTDGDITSPKGDQDMWLLKITKTGALVWQRNLGGTGIDRASKVLTIPGGGCVVLGRTRSTDLDCISNHGMFDGLFAEYSATGTLVQKRCIGGEADDHLYDVILAADGNYILCGESISSTDDLAGTGAGTSWIIKINRTNLATMWSRIYQSPNTGVDGLSNLYRIMKCADGSGYIATGYTTPNFNDFNLDNLFLLKIDLSGTIIWENQSGATNTGDYPSAILEAANGDFYVAGSITSGTGAGLTGAYLGGPADMWIRKFNTTGTPIFAKNYGGTNWEFVFDMKKDAANNIYLAGFTRSINNDASRPTFGGMDNFIVKINPNGDTLYTQRHGGSANDVAMGIAIYGADDFIVAGRTASPNGGCVHGSKGQEDVWVVGYKSTSNLEINETEQNEFTIYPNPTNGILHISSNDIHTIRVTNILGETVFETTNFMDSKIDLSNLLSGTYFMQSQDKNGKIMENLIQLMK